MNPIHNPENYRINAAERRTCLGALFLLWLYDRLKCGICGPNPLPSKRLRHAVQVLDPGYCLDAPEAIPAGGMSNFCVPPCDYDEPPQWLPEQQLCDRA